jgi:hypothetical protein
MLFYIEDPLQGDFPEVIEEYLEHGIMKCIAFNRRGTLLAGNYHLPYFFMQINNNVLTKLCILMTELHYL